MLISPDGLIPPEHLKLPIFDLSNPKCLYRVVPVEWQDIFVKTPIRFFTFSAEHGDTKATEFFALCDRKSKGIDGESGATPNIPASFRRFKIKFWEEFDRVVASDDLFKLDIDYISAGTLSSEEINFILANEILIAWLVSGLTEYKNFIRDIHELGLRRQLEVMEIPVDPVEPNMQLIGLQLRIFQRMDDRINGAIAQNYRIQQKNLNVNIEATQGKRDTQPKLTLKDLEQRILELQKRSKLLEIPAMVNLDEQKIITGAIMKLDGCEQKITGGHSQADGEVISASDDN